jgi:hypothetical protein
MLIFPKIFVDYQDMYKCVQQKAICTRHVLKNKGLKIESLSPIQIALDQILVEISRNLFSIRLFHYTIQSINRENSNLEVKQNYFIRNIIESSESSEYFHNLQSSHLSNFEEIYINRSWRSVVLTWHFAAEHLFYSALKIFDNAVKDKVPFQNLQSELLKHLSFTEKDRVGYIESFSILSDIRNSFHNSGIHKHESKNYSLGNFSVKKDSKLDFNTLQLTDLFIELLKYKMLIATNENVLEEWKKI